jgi:putative spermidine/putrescine transport system permease protein
VSAQPEAAVGPAAARAGIAWHRRNWWALLALPTVVLLVIVFAYPVGVILSRAFTNHTSSPGDAFANLSWFFGNDTQVRVLLRTFLTAGVVTAICLVVAYPYAYLATIVGPRWRILLLGIAVISCWQSILVRNYAWRVLLRDEGVINDLLHALGFGRAELLGTTKGVIIGMTQVMAPFMILPLYANMRTIDRRLLSAAHSLGASRSSAFLRIYLPLSLPGIAAGCLLVGVLSLGFYITPALLGSPSNSLLSQAMVLTIGRELDWGHAGAMALVLVACTGMILALGALLGRRPMASVTGRGRS